MHKSDKSKTKEGCSNRNSAGFGVKIISVPALPRITRDYFVHSTKP